MKKSQLKKLIKEIISEVGEDPSIGGSSNEVTFSVKGANGSESSFSMPVEVARGLSTALASALGASEPAGEPEGEPAEMPSPAGPPMKRSGPPHAEPDGDEPSPETPEEEEDEEETAEED